MTSKSKASNRRCKEKRQNTWHAFLKAHWDFMAAIDLTNIIELNYPPTPYLHEDQDKKR
jgi:hypothetical protein